MPLKPPSPLSGRSLLPPRTAIRSKPLVPRTSHARSYTPSGHPGTGTSTTGGHVTGSGSGSTASAAAAAAAATRKAASPSKHLIWYREIVPAMLPVIGIGTALFFALQLLQTHLSHSRFLYDAQIRITHLENELAHLQTVQRKQAVSWGDSLGRVVKHVQEIAVGPKEEIEGTGKPGVDQEKGTGSSPSKPTTPTSHVVAKAGQPPSSPPPRLSSSSKQENDPVLRTIAANEHQAVETDSAQPFDLAQRVKDVFGTNAISSNTDENLALATSSPTVTPVEESSPAVSTRRWSWFS